MGGLFSRLPQTDINEDKIYTWNSDGDLQMSEFQTGDLVFFSEEFPDSTLSRTFKRIQGKLWTNCGVVVVMPDLWQNQLLLLETAGTHPDDFLQDKLTLKNVGRGLRLVPLSDRIQSMKFEAIGIRKMRPREIMRPTDTRQHVVLKCIEDVQNQKQSPTEQTLAVDTLKKLKIIKVPYAQPSLDSLSGSGLDRLALYSKLEIYAFKNLKNNVSPNMELAKR